MTNDEKRLLALKLVQEAIELTRESMPRSSNLAAHLDGAELLLRTTSPKPDVLEPT